MFYYCRAMIWRISASSSLINSPLTSTVTLSISPVNSNGGAYSGVTGEPLSVAPFERYLTQKYGAIYEF